MKRKHHSDLQDVRWDFEVYSITFDGRAAEEGGSETGST